jgi:uncharacterized SAM-binding protein YcdF (DUF218 family)
MVSWTRSAWFHVRWWIWLIRLLAAIFLTIVVIFVITCVQVWYTGTTDDRRPSDVVVVLGASQYNGRPSAVFAARLDHALALYQAGVAPRVVTVGGRLPGDRFTEAQAGAHYLSDRGIPGEDLVVVGEGSDTLASLTAVAGVMDLHDWKRTVLVTDPWHTLRARAMARDLGLDAVTSPVTAGPSVRGVGTKVRYVAREAFAYRFYQLFHHASPPGAKQPAL